MHEKLKSIRKSVNWSSRRRCSTLRMSWQRLTWAWNWAGRLWTCRHTAVRTFKKRMLADSASSMKSMPGWSDVNQD